MLTDETSVNSYIPGTIQVRHCFLSHFFFNSLMSDNCLFWIK